MQTKWRILKAISAGYSYEQIMADNSRLSHREVFRVIGEASTSFWKKAAASRRGGVAPLKATEVDTAVRHLKD